jgi:predicted ATPase
MAGGIELSTEIAALFSKALAKQKAKSETEAVEVIEEVKSRAEEKTRAYADTINKIKAEAIEAIAAVKAEAVEKARRAQSASPQALKHIRTQSIKAKQPSLVPA